MLKVQHKTIISFFSIYLYTLILETSISTTGSICPFWRIKEIYFETLHQRDLLPVTTNHYFLSVSFYQRRKTAHFYSYYQAHIFCSLKKQPTVTQTQSWSRHRNWKGLRASAYSWQGMFKVNLVDALVSTANKHSWYTCNACRVLWQAYGRSTFIFFKCTVLNSKWSASFSFFFGGCFFFSLVSSIYVILYYPSIC